MPNNKPKLVLGSASPRRRDLLKQIGIAPDVIHAADLDESVRPRELPAPYVLRVAKEKNAAIAEKFPDAFVITGDTTVAVGRRILGKAVDEKEAREMLGLLSGRAHKIITAVVVSVPLSSGSGAVGQTKRKIANRVTTSRVRVKRLSDRELDAFIAAGEWEDCAGAYKFQGNFAQYILSAEGSISGIIGLPLYETATLLRGLGYDF
jgi:septum formation protein